MKKYLKQSFKIITATIFLTILFTKSYAEEKVFVVDNLKVEGKSLFLEGLDAVDGTPILDIKPYTKCFLPKEEIFEPSWIQEIMENYYKRSE